jgi:lipopolysaccharide export system protein LptA
MKPRLTLALLLILPLAASAAEVPPQSTELQCEHGEMWSVNTETHAIFTGAVTLTGTDLKILCDRMEIIAEGVGDKTATIPTFEKFKYILATGHVRIVQGDREATSGRAEVLPREDKVVLTEDPVVIDHGTGWIDHGEKITMLHGERRVLVDKPRFTGPAIKDLGFDKDKPVTPPDGAPKAEPAK